MKTVLKLMYTALPFKKEIFSFLKLFIQLPESVYKHLHFKGTIKLKINPGASFKIKHYGYQVENDLFWTGLTGSWEKTSLSLWTRLCQTNNTVLDIGANTGIYALISKTINPHSEVYAIEPVSFVFDKLVANCQLNKFDIKCLNVAASDFDGEAKIFLSSLDHVYSVTVNKNLSNSDVKVHEQTIHTKKLETIIKENKIGKIDLMKIDVETHEVEVLKGMGNFLGEYRPTLLIEILNDEVGSGIEKMLAGMDYLYFNIEEANGVVKKVDHLVKRPNYNYLICNEYIAKQLNLIK